MRRSRCTARRPRCSRTTPLSTPADIFEKTIHHGLIYRPSKLGIKSDFVKSGAGVFPLLYKARTGLTIPKNEKLPILKLLANTTDIGHELPSADLGRIQTTPIEHLIVSDYERQSWSLIMFPEPDPAILRCPSSRRFLGDHFEQISENDIDSLRSMFITRAAAAGGALQAKRIYQPPVDPVAVLSELEEMVRPIQGHRTYVHDEWAPSLWRAKWLPMPPDLARYAAMFYCSSVVRYRPSFVHDDPTGEAAWILSTFVMEARLLLLRSAVQGITGEYLEMQQGVRR
jgi:hypothetical protein